MYKFRDGIENLRDLLDLRRLSRALNLADTVDFAVCFGN